MSKKSVETKAKIITGEIKNLAVIIEAAIPANNATLGVMEVFELSNDAVEIKGSFIEGEKPFFGFDIFDKKANVSGFFMINIADIAIELSNEFTSQVKSLDIKAPSDSIVEDFINNATKEKAFDFESKNAKRSIKTSTTSELEAMFTLSKVIMESIKNKGVHSGLDNRVLSIMKKLNLSNDPSLTEVLSKIKLYFTQAPSKKRVMKDFYDITCPECHQVMLIQPSASQESGDDEGSYSNCDNSDCNVRFGVQYLPVSDTMLAVSIKDC